MRRHHKLTTLNWLAHLLTRRSSERTVELPIRWLPGGRETAWIKYLAAGGGPLSTWQGRNNLGSGRWDLNPRLPDQKVGSSCQTAAGRRKLLIG